MSAAEAAALGASAAVAQFLASQQHPLASAAGPACLQQQTAEQDAPSMHALQYQMKHIRQLHLNGVRASASAGGRGSLGQQQQQQSVPATPGQMGSGANTRAVSTPMTQRQRQHLWADFPVLRPSQDTQVCDAVCGVLGALTSLFCGPVMTHRCVMLCDAVCGVLGALGDCTACYT
jgi:hypothetical protein